MGDRRSFLKQVSGVVLAGSAVSESWGLQVEDGVAKAQKADLAVMGKAEADPYRPLFHFHPPANHMNDPNGTIFFEGWHHLFYQHNPYAAHWGSIHWGHARSRDLVNWEHLPIALAPSLAAGETQCFSGSAIVAADGRPRLLYTSIGSGMPMHPEQWLALPTDKELFTWQRFAGNPVMADSIHHGLRVEDWRDPFMFRHAGQVYAVCGGNASRREKGGTGEVLLYRATRGDLTAWEFLRVIFRYRSEDVINIECPNLFPLDGRWVLVVSPHRSCEYFIGDFDPAQGEFRPDTQGLVDAGHAYATNISHDADGRTILWIWGQPHAPVPGAWSGCLAMPRHLSIGADGFLRQQPVAAFNELRQAPVHVTPFSLPGGRRVLPNVSGECLEIEAELSTGNAKRFGFELRRSASGEPGLVVAIHPNESTLQVGDVRHVIGRRKSYKLRIFLDRCAVEVFEGDGKAAIFANTLASPEDRAVAFFSEGSDTPSHDPYFPDETSEPAALTSFTCWPMKPAAFDSSRFRAKA